MMFNSLDGTRDAPCPSLLLFGTEGTGWQTRQLSTVGAHFPHDGHAVNRPRCFVQHLYHFIIFSPAFDKRRLGTKKRRVGQARAAAFTSLMGPRRIVNARGTCSEAICGILRRSWGLDRLPPSGRMSRP